MVLSSYTNQSTEAGSVFGSDRLGEKGREKREGAGYGRDNDDY